VGCENEKFVVVAQAGLYLTNYLIRSLTRALFR